MARTNSTMLPLGTDLPPFELPNLEGNMVASEDLKGNPTLIIFLCNHCPYVKHVISKLSELVKSYQQRGLKVVGINSNDIENYPQDAPDQMKEFAAEHSFSFPYLFDETQEVAKAYRAACTPDFFLFDANHKLVYRGQMDDSRPKTDIPITGKDLNEAVDKLLAGEPLPEDQIPSVGCNIKWKPGNEPEYFG